MSAQRILLSGASGFIGSSLLTYFRQKGHEVVRLVRHLDDQSSDAICWNPQDFEGFSVVIHLAGENIAAKRWTPAQKEKLLSSRCLPTARLVEILSSLDRPPHTLICASAVGFYGNRGSEVLTEKSPCGNGFLADICASWESSTVVPNNTIRVVNTRFGNVLSKKGGMLKKIIPLFKWGLGGKIGSGEQIMSWIALDDVLSAMEHILHTKIEGPVNFTAPQPISQAEFAKNLAKKLHRPCFLHIPACVIKCALGQMGEELLLSSISAYPQKLLDSGYQFRCPNSSCFFELFF